MVREAFSFWTGHPFDFELWVRLGYAVVNGGNPYGNLGAVPGLSFADVYTLRDSATIAYLPFWPLITGWLYEIYLFAGFGNRFVYYFLLKQPIIAGDLWLAYLLYKFVNTRNEKATLWVLLFWVFSPFTIIISGIWGMFDSIAMSLVMLSITARNEVKKATWVGMATLAKSVPVIYVLPLAIIGKKGWTRILLGFVLPALFSVIIFLVFEWSLSSVTGALTYTAARYGESMSIWDSFFYLDYLGILPHLSDTLYALLGLLWIPAILIITATARKRFGFDTDYGLVQSLLAITLIFLIFKARITEQYSIYLLALSIIDIALWNIRRKSLLFATMAVATIYLFVNNFFLVRFLSPIYPGFTQFESSLNVSFGAIRLTLNLITGTAFTVLNIRYLVKVLGRAPASH